MRTFLFYLSIICGIGLMPMKAQALPVEHPLPLTQNKENLRFNYLTVNDGLYGNATLCSLQDEKGFMWLGTWYGLYKYDGRKLVHVLKQDFMGKPLGNIIMRLMEDAQHRIWAITKKGLAIWDAPYNREFPVEEIGLEKTVSSEISSFCQDAEKNIWLGGKHLLFCYSQQDSKLHDYSSLLEGIDSEIAQIYQDKEEHLWIGTEGDGIFRLEPKTDLNSSADSEIPWSLTTAPVFSDFNKATILSVFQDSHHAFWISTFEGSYRIQRSEKGDYISQPLLIEDTSTHPAQEEKIIIRNFVEFDNKIYASTSNGVMTFSLATQEISFIQADPTAENSLKSNSVYHVLIDREGTLWASTFNGGVNYTSFRQADFSYGAAANLSTQGDVVKAIVEDDEKNIWIGWDEKGICQWNRKTDKITHYSQQSKTPFTLTSDKIQAVYEKDNRLFLGTYGNGMDIVNLKTNRVVNYNANNTYPDNLSSYVYTFASKDESTIWVGGMSALYTLNIHTGESHLVKKFNMMIRKIATDNEGDLWIFNNDTLSLFKNKENAWENYRDEDPNGLSINEASTMTATRGSIYIGTYGKGLWMFDKIEKKFHRVIDEPLRNVLILTILEEDNVLWITTNQGLFKYHKVTQKMEHYTNKDGLNSTLFCPNAGVVTSDGLVIVGSIDGINAFYPSMLKKSLSAPQVMLTDLYLFNKVVDPQSENSPLERTLAYCQQLTIHERNHNIAFRVSSSNYSKNEKNLFEYRLDPYETSWQRMEGSRDMAFYNNLPPGEYTFRVRTSNGEGLWSDEEALNLTILPFWWKSTPMLLVYILLVLSFIGWSVFRYRRRKKEEMRIFQFEKEQEMYHSKMEFFTYIVHEIRTPLTLILGPLSSIMKKKEQFPQIVPDLQIIERSGNRLLTLVNQLMDFRKVEEKSYVVQLGKVNVRDLLSEVTKDFCFMRASQKVVLEEVYPDEACWAHVDREAVTKIFINLLSNAFKFTHDRIRVELSATEDGNYWQISVSDNGCGIAPEDQKLIFDSFYQVSQTMPSDSVGTGIGLFLVRNLLDLQGGKIAVKSKVNEGTSFIIQLPKAEIGQKQLEEAPASSVVEEVTETNEQQLPQKKRLLVAEDNEDMCEYITSIFADTYTVQTCHNGQEALDSVMQQEYDLIITDLMMPVMDGMTLCKTLKQQIPTSHIPVVILTAKVDEQTQIEGLESDADAYVTKPFSAEVLKAQIHSILHNRERMCTKFYQEPEVSAKALCANKTDMDFIEKINEYILAHLADTELEVDSLAMEMGMGRSVFYKKMKVITGLTPNDYIRTYRLKRAVALFKMGENRINEVCYQVGFSSPSYFSKRFTMQFGYSPSEFLKQQEEAAASE